APAAVHTTEINAAPAATAAPPPVAEVSRPTPKEEPKPGPTWDALGGGMHQGDHLAMAGLTQTLDVSLTYLYGVADSAQIGLSVANDTPGSTTASAAAIYVAIAVRLGLMQSDTMSFGLRLDPGVQVIPNGTAAAVNVTLNLGANLGVWLMPHL